MKNSQSEFDIIIVGAGLSGIGAAYRIQNSCPHLKYSILEGRSKIGGTWDLFKYPGIRSDSDMYTFGFPFSPWKNPKAIADGSDILKYINDTADKFDIREKIQFNRNVVSSSWSTKNKKWLLKVENRADKTIEHIHCNFLYMCSGYYDYKNGYTPTFPNKDSFKGKIIHPQHWDTELDYTDKKITIIGSGATAVTLLPILAEKAKLVTMLQRSPTYILNLPSEDGVANFLKKMLPPKIAHTISRWKNILFNLAFYEACQKWPKTLKKFLKNKIKRSLGDKYIDKHFDPKYGPWDQRLCLVPDNNFFDALKNNNAEVVTDTIKTFNEEGILLNSNKQLNADIIITATGLKVQMFGGMELLIDDKKIDASKLHAYKGVMLSDIPNFFVAIGYTNASWTLKCDLNAQFATKVLNHLKDNNYTVCVPKFNPDKIKTERLLDFDAGYVLRAIKFLPKQGDKAPWKVYQNYFKDLFSLKYGKANDEYLTYH